MYKMFTLLIPIFSKVKKNRRERNFIIILVIILVMTKTNF